MRVLPAEITSVCIGTGPVRDSSRKATAGEAVAFLRGAQGEGNDSLPDIGHKRAEIAAEQGEAVLVAVVVSEFQFLDV